MKRIFLALLVSFVTAGVGVCQQNELSQGFSSNPPATAAINTDVNHDGYSIFSLDQAKDLLLNTVCASKVCDPEAKDFYAIIHVLKWAPVQNDKQTVAGEHWYTYHSSKYGWNQENFTDNKRLFGAKYFYLLYIHLNVADTVPYAPVYEIQITKKLPQNVADVFALLQLETSGAAKAAARPPVYSDAWGGRIFNVGQRPSDIKVDPRILADASKPVSSSSEATAAQTFNNEGKYWWDVSVAVPVKKISDVKFNSTNNTVTPVQTATTNMFGVIDIYLKPVDLSQSNYSLIPHPIAGVSLAQQPLHKILVGGAIGVYFAEVYVGALFVKQQSVNGLSTGIPATPDQVAAATHYSYKTQFTVGINVPVRSLLNAVKSKK